MTRLPVLAALSLAALMVASCATPDRDRRVFVGARDRRGACVASGRMAVPCSRSRASAAPGVPCRPPLPRPRSGPLAIRCPHRVPSDRGIGGTGVLGVITGFRQRLRRRAGGSPLDPQGHRHRGRDGPAGGHVACGVGQIVSLVAADPGCQPAHERAYPCGTRSWERRARPGRAGSSWLGSACSYDRTPWATVDPPPWQPGCRQWPARPPRVPWSPAASSLRLPRPARRTAPTLPIVVRGRPGPRRERAAPGRTAGASGRRHAGWPPPGSGGSRTGQVLGGGHWWPKRCRWTCSPVTQPRTSGPACGAT